MTSASHNAVYNDLFLTKVKSRRTPVVKLEDLFIMSVDKPAPNHHDLTFSSTSLTISPVKKHDGLAHLDDPEVSDYEHVFDDSLDLSEEKIMIQSDSEDEPLMTKRRPPPVILSLTKKPSSKEDTGLVLLFHLQPKSLNKTER